MISMSIRNVKMNFSKVLMLVERGEDVIIRNRQKPIAKISSFKESEKAQDFATFLDGLTKMRSAQKLAPKGHTEKIIRADRDGRG